MFRFEAMTGQQKLWMEILLWLVVMHTLRQLGETLAWSRGLREI